MNIARRNVILLAAVLLALLWSGGLRGAEPFKKFDKPVPAPEFTGIDQWINTKPLTMKDLKGRVVVIHFWTFGCINCLHNLPHYQAWQKDFAGPDLVIIGIHTPESDSEKKIENVEANVKKREIAYPVAIDGSATMWKAWHTSYWPSVALVDRQGNVRYTWEGELNWQGTDGEVQMRRHIKELLAEPAKKP